MFTQNLCSAACNRRSKAQTLIKFFDLEVFDRPSDSPEHVPSDYHLSRYPTIFSRGRCLATDEKVQTALNNWLSSQAIEFYKGGFTRGQHCLDNKCMHEKKERKREQRHVVVPS
ncbi:hypothetical protein AVEN_213412-1 [Araneus ventricosus]|uniref:Histone-lysine N-methyltransferase SETMAR n=1 Tax=Araneus ventricosus TaxID=182803 RepID=A0A4Y2QC77_ARAVE|nr:hypothetical protein AVEN_213412-1 [Araneus ventricosus]